MEDGWEEQCWSIAVITDTCTGPSNSQKLRFSDEQKSVTFWWDRSLSHDLFTSQP